MMSPRTTRTVVIVAGVFVTAALHAQAPQKPASAEAPIKIRVINAAEIMQSSEFGKQEGEKLKALEKQLKDAMDKKQQALNQEVNAFQTMSKEAREKKEPQLIAMDNDLKSTVEASKAQFERAYQRSTENFFGEMRQGVMKVAQEQDLDLVFDGNSGQLMYASDRVLVTGDVIKAMDTNFSKTKAPKPAAPKAPAQTTAAKK